MRVALEMYPEVLITDTTYSLCSNNMPLIVYEVVDCFGAGRLAGYAIIISEKKEIVTGALEMLTLGFPDMPLKNKVVVIDKDQSEVAAINTVLPNSEIHLCDYHVKEVFKRAYVRKLTDKNWDEVDPLIKKLIHAYSKEDYDMAYNQLSSLVGKDSKFMVYFNNNWHNSPLVWTEYKRNMSFTVGERTTGRVENRNGKIKQVISRKMAVALVIRRLRSMNTISSVQNDYKLFKSLAKTSYHKYSSDPVVQTIMKVNTPFVADIVKRQYERSLEPPSSTSHALTCESCDCPFFIKFKLPCSHIFRERRIKGVDIYDHTLIPQRWTIDLECGKARDNTLTRIEIIAAPLKTNKRKGPMTSEERFNVVQHTLKELGPYIYDCGGDQFQNRLNSVLSMIDIFKKGGEVAVVGTGDVTKCDKLLGQYPSN
ncbi:hypothetical protein ONE63_011371 [Megalurothrips usitatus]|uniref:SWIM-type domain-containing protein n=1 Tax=Megalurothrips usitatus TaxID=439358 RepID=A0AAV7X3N1_9NEOP|nr:hypothetical protein ONE63_011371 [Megalurothrips usitatus]